MVIGPLDETLTSTRSVILALSRDASLEDPSLPQRTLAACLASDASLSEVRKGDERICLNGLSQHLQLRDCQQI